MQFTTKDILENLNNSEGKSLERRAKRFRDSLRKVICEEIEAQYEDKYSANQYKESLTQLINFAQKKCGYYYYYYYFLLFIYIIFIIYSKPINSFIKYRCDKITQSEYKENNIHMFLKNESCHGSYQLQYYKTTWVDFYDLTYFDLKTYQPELLQQPGNLFNNNL